MGEEHRFSVPKPLEVGQEFKVTIENVNGQGEGITRANDFMIFVKGAHRNESCKVKITDVKRTYAIAEKK